MTKALFLTVPGEPGFERLCLPNDLKPIIRKHIHRLPVTIEASYLSFFRGLMAADFPGAWLIVCGLADYGKIHLFLDKYEAVEVY